MKIDSATIIAAVSAHELAEAIAREVSEILAKLPLATEAQRNPAAITAVVDQHLQAMESDLIAAAERAKTASLKLVDMVRAGVALALATHARAATAAVASRNAIPGVLQ